MLLWKGLKPGATHGRQLALRPRALAGYQGSGEAGLGAGNNPRRPLWDRKWRLPAPPPPERAGAPGSPENPERILALYTRGWGRSGALASRRNWVRPPRHAPRGSFSLAVCEEGNVRFGSRPSPGAGSGNPCPHSAQGNVGSKLPEDSRAGDPGSWVPAPERPALLLSPRPWLLSSLPSLFGSCSRGGRTSGGSGKGGRARESGGAGGGAYKGVRKSQGRARSGDVIRGRRPTGTATREPRCPHPS